MSQSLLQTFLKDRYEFYGLIWSLLRRFEDAEEVFQETALALTRQDQDPDLEVRDAHAWIREVIRRTAHTHIRRMQKERRIHTLPAAALAEWIGNSFEDPVESDEIAREQEALRTCLDGMKPAHSEILQMRLVESKSYDEIADGMQRRPDAIRQLLVRARKILMSCIQQKLQWGEP